MDVDVVEVFGKGILEKLLPERGKMEVGVGEEEESDLEFGVFGGEVGECVGGVGEKGGAVEEREVVKLIGERDWDERVMPTKLDLRKKKIWNCQRRNSCLSSVRNSSSTLNSSFRVPRCYFVT